ncbi:major facilitator superfamily domain-containing protein [Mycena crocata]|nr:major facilitator superfamily domain-containing protein [Mycena crocata]
MLISLRFLLPLVACSMGVLSLGSFQHYFGLDKMTASEKAWLDGNIVGILQLGCLFGPFSVGYFSSRYSRKPCLLASGIIFVIGSIVQVVVGLGTTKVTALSLLYAGRFLGGIGVGMVTVLVPSYVSECTLQAIHGRCTGFIQVTINAGIMLSCGFYFPLYLPESPRYMVEHEQYDRTARTLAFLFGTTSDDTIVLTSIDTIKSDFVGKRKLSVSQQIKCFIPSVVMFFQQWTSTNAINYFSPQIFASLDIDGTTAGSRYRGGHSLRCLIAGGLGQSAMMLWIGTYSALHPPTTTPVAPPASSYISIVAVYLYAMFYSIGWGLIPWIVAAEVAPNHLRTAVISIATGINWLFSLTISKLTPIMLNELGYGTFLLFGLCCVAMAFWAWLFRPETAGLGLEEIGLLFEKDIILQALQDAPGGNIFIGNRRAVPIVKYPSASAHCKHSISVLRLSRGRKLGSFLFLW